MSLSNFVPKNTTDFPVFLQNTTLCTQKSSPIFNYRKQKSRKLFQEELHGYPLSTSFFLSYLSFSPLYPTFRKTAFRKVVILHGR